MSTTSSTKLFLHVGCGAKRQNQTTRGFSSAEWAELRLDIDLAHSPDITGSMTDMSGVASGSVDAVYSSHNIEHLYPHEVPIALAEFKRVLRPDGFAVITCPDLKSVSKLISENKLTEPAYQSPAGPIAPVDIIYGHRDSMARGNLFMAHRCGFTEKVLSGTIRAAGFAAVATIARGFAPFFDLWAVASVADRSEGQLRALASSHFPGKDAGNR
jgi:predicted SAM-dependent methyltransferase